MKSKSTAAILLLLAAIVTQGDLGAAPVRRPPVRDVSYVTVPCTGPTADDPWTNTKIWVRKDRQFIVQDKNAEVVGQPPATHWSVDAPAGTTDLDGFKGRKAGANFLLPGADVGCLIGKVDKEIFALGNKATVPGNVEGYLFLAANDYPGAFHDNTGAGDVMVASERP